MNGGDFTKIPKPIMGYKAGSIRYISLALAKANEDKSIEASLNGLAANLGVVKAKKLAAPLPANRQHANRVTTIQLNEASYSSHLSKVKDDPEYGLLLDQVRTKIPLVQLSKGTKGGQKIAVVVVSDGK